MPSSTRIINRVDAVVKRLSLHLPIARHDSPQQWIDQIENRLNGRFPDDFRHFFAHYSFPPLTLGPIELFANCGDGGEEDVTSAPFRDLILASWLDESRYFHFARLSTGCYDPVCVPLLRDQSSRAQILSFNHEAILMECSHVESEIIAESFLDLLLKHLHGDFVS